MIIKLSAVACISIVMCCGTVPIAIAAEDSDGQPQDELSVTKTHLQQAKQKIDELERQLKQRIGELVLQLHAKENEIATQITNAHANSKQLREDLASRTEELNQAKRRVAELEQQIATSGKGQELAQAKRRVAEAEQLAARKEQELAQAKRRVTDVEQQLAAVAKEQELAQPKRRAVEADQLAAGKEQELTQAKRRAAEAEQQLAWKEQELAQAKRRVTEIEQQLSGKEQELAQARRRAGEVEQQLAGKEQELAQAKRRTAEADQQTAGKEQELAQAKRRAGDAEQQTAKKEQELAQVKEEIKHVTQKLADLNPQLLAKDAELTRAKQLLVEFELNSSKPAAPTAAQEESPPTLSLLPIDHTLSLSTPTGPDPEGTDDGEAFSSNGDLGKISESLANLLQPELKKGSATLRQRGNRLTLALTTGELFSTGDATVTLGGTSLLERLGVALHGFRYQSIEIAGHTDNTPLRNDPRKGFRDNLDLSRARAEHAVQVLINGGIEADRVKAIGYADSKPIATNETEKGRNKNRRMEIVITQGTESGGAVGDGKTQGGRSAKDALLKR
ncbi:OmpA family protein [Candidatus Nitrospira nitrificans]|uniref:Putative Outer membrane protein, OmpA/MotB family n=1 Tax=Candidatus Nitrospira nitrificans TaxID=1742973 RepID=A0A0S4LLN4_9BACT|nr:OmpA family protein [Candidatus Nitrospira nitrificans]CUS38405.1 putative Outer membrane protein, OmpA/MotB family [Candidatus Nitrospira nitrificans]